MTTALLGGLVAACLAIAAEGYFLIGRQQRLTDRLEQAADALERLLPTVPGKSAPRTGPPEEWPSTRPLSVVGPPIPDQASQGGTEALSGLAGHVNETEQYGKHAHRPEARTA